MVPEAPLAETEYGLVGTAGGWFVLNARDAVWYDKKGRGFSPGLDCRGRYDQLGLGLTVLAPGEPMSMYHWESDQEDFLVLSGEAMLIVEGQERPLRAWDFVHCPPRTKHTIVGAGDGPCLVFGVGARANHTYRTADGTLEGKPGESGYAVDEAAIRHGAGPEEETEDSGVAYARFPQPQPTPYREGLLPG